MWRLTYENKDKIVVSFITGPILGMLDIVFTLYTNKAIMYTLMIICGITFFIGFLLIVISDTKYARTKEELERGATIDAIVLGLCGGIAIGFFESVGYIGSESRIAHIISFFILMFIIAYHIFTTYQTIPEVKENEV